MNNEDLKMKGSFLIRALDKDTGNILKVWRIDNQLMVVNQNIRAQLLMGTYAGGADGLEIKYFAFGTGNRAVTANDTTLQNEVYRKQITQISNPSVGVVQSVVSLGSQECNYDIKEIGVFVGPDALGTTDSGILLARVLVNIEKNTNMVLNIVRTDTCTI